MNHSCFHELNYGSIADMKKTEAIEMLGGTVTAAAKAIGVSYQAVNKWPDDLTQKIQDRVVAAVVRLHPRDWEKRWPNLVPGGTPHAHP